MDKALKKEISEGRNILRAHGLAELYSENDHIIKNYLC